MTGRWPGDSAIRNPQWKKLSVQAKLGEILFDDSQSGRRTVIYPINRLSTAPCEVATMQERQF
eukprot:4462806-Pleurochrysis_carterae.AAC.8